MSGVTKKKASASSASRELIKVGPKDVKISKNGSKKDKDGRRPTTSAALVLRSGKYGSFGTGEMVLATKLSGREKLDLLAGGSQEYCLYFSRPYPKLIMILSILLI